MYHDTAYLPQSIKLKKTHMLQTYHTWFQYLVHQHNQLSLRSISLFQHKMFHSRSFTNNLNNNLSHIWMYRRDSFLTSLTDKLQNQYKTHFGLSKNTLLGRLFDSLTTIHILIISKHIYQVSMLDLTQCQNIMKNQKT